MYVIVEQANGKVLSATSFRTDTAGLDLAVKHMQALIVGDIANAEFPREAAEKYAERYNLDNIDDRVNGNLTYYEGDFVNDPNINGYSVVFLDNVENGHTKQQQVKFKVFSISENANSFGLYGHRLMSRDGKFFEGARHRGGGTPLLKKGDVLEFFCNAEGHPVNAYGEHCFEFFERMSPDPPPVVVSEVWAMPGELVPR